MLRIIMLSGIIKGSPTSSCFLGLQEFVTRGRCGVARGWAGSCAITIKKLRELAGKSRTMLVRLRLCRTFAKADALSTKMTTANSRVATAELRSHTTGHRPRLGQPQIEFTIE